MNHKDSFEYISTCLCHRCRNRPETPSEAIDRARAQIRAQYEQEAEKAEEAYQLRLRELSKILNDRMQALESLKDFL
jgi:hypothetical protein